MVGLGCAAMAVVRELPIGVCSGHVDEGLQGRGGELHDGLDARLASLVNDGLGSPSNPL